MSSNDPLSSDSETLKDDDDVYDSSKDDAASNADPKDIIIRYSMPTLLSMRNSKLSQAKPTCLKLDLSCMAHHKPPPKMLIANMMPKFALNQMQGRGEESISPVSFHSNSSSSSNLSYQKRFQDREQRVVERGDRERGERGERGERDDGRYGENRYYFNKYNNKRDNSLWDDPRDTVNGGSRIIYKTTSANASNGNNIRFLKKAYNSKYEDEESASSGLMLSSANILENSSRVITTSSMRKKREEMEAAEQARNNERSDGVKSDSKNNNDKGEGGEKDAKNDLKNLPNDITNQMDDMFSDLNLNQLLPDNLMAEERESSRFSKWFSVGQEGERRGESRPDAQNNNNDVQRQMTFPPAQSVESEKYFQPIEKVEINNPLFQMLKGGAPPNDGKNDNNPLMQMIQGQQKSPNSGQVHSVEELEAKLRHHRGEESANDDNSQKVLQNFFQQQQLMPNVHQAQQQQHPQQQKPPQHQQQQQQQQQQPPQNQEDINAFRKLLSQMASDDKVLNVMPPNGQQNNMMPMMGKNFQPPPQQQQPTPDMVMQQFQKLAAAGKMMNNQQNPIAPHIIPSQPFANNIDMMKFMQQQQQQKMQIPHLPEIVKRPEVQAIVQDLSSGEIAPITLIQRLQSQGLAPIDREIISAALNIFNANGNAVGGFVKPNNLFAQLKGPQMPIPQQSSPLSPVPPPIDPHLLFQHQAQAAAAANKLRLSPLPAAGNFGLGAAVLPSNLTNNLTLHVPGGMPQRIPSPRELQFHTQSIMQNALIRKKLEEQRENYRKRQEQEQKDVMQKQDIDKKVRQPDAAHPIENQVMSPDEKTINDSPSKKASGVPPMTQQQVQRAHAPSPNIFTPTSVLRKMTAEKDSDPAKEKKKAIIGGNQPPGQPIRGQQPMQNIQQLQQNQQQQLQFMGNMSQFDRMMQQQNEAFGKSNWDAQSPIKPSVGASGRPIVKAGAAPGMTQPNQMQPQQQPGNMIPIANFEFQQQQQQQLQKLNMQMMQLKKQQIDNPALSQYLAQQQQRAQQQMLRNQHFPQQQMGGFQQQPPMMQGRPKEQEELENRMMNNGGLSPTSNQLAKWFSPELLADASAGKLPSTRMNGGGQMMSLEEFEKCIQNN